MNLLDNLFFVIYSDTFFTIDFWEFLKEFNKKYSKNNKMLGMILVHPNNHPQDSDLVELDKNNKLVGLYGYPHKTNLDLRNIVNAAYYLLKKELFSQTIENLQNKANVDIAKDIFPLAIKNGYEIFGCKTSVFIKDMGTPKRLIELEKTIFSGQLNNLSPKSQKK